MARSRKKTPICGITTARSEKQDKRLANRKVRRAVNQALTTSLELEVLPHRRELTNPWTMAKDGKTWFDADRFPEELRK
jgi:hypothetical protein